MRYVGITCRQPSAYLTNKPPINGNIASVNPFLWHRHFLSNIPNYGRQGNPGQDQAQKDDKTDQYSHNYHVFRSWFAHNITIIIWITVADAWCRRCCAIVVDVAFVVPEEILWCWWFHDKKISKAPKVFLLVIKTHSLFSSGHFNSSKPECLNVNKRQND